MPYVLHNPGAVYRRRTGYLGPLGLSDFHDRESRSRHEVYGPNYHTYWRIVDSVGIQLHPSSTRTARIGLESTERDFTNRDRRVLELLRPHLAARHRNTRLRRSRR